MSMIDKLKDLTNFRTKKSHNSEPQAQPAPVELDNGMDPVSFELNEQREMLKAFYKHKVKENLYQHHVNVQEGNATEASPELEKVYDLPLEEQKEVIGRYAGQMADVHMQKLYPTSAEMAKMREAEDISEEFDLNLRNAERTARAKESVAAEHTQDRPSEVAKAEQTAALANSSYANLAAQNGDITKSIQDNTGMRITLNEHDNEELSKFHDQCKDRAHEAVKGTNPRLDTMLAEKAMGSDDVIKDAIDHHKKYQEEQVNEQAQETMLHEGGEAAIQAKMQKEAMDAGLDGDEKAFDGDHMHRETKLAEHVMGKDGREYSEAEIAERKRRELEEEEKGLYEEFTGAFGLGGR